MSMKAVNEAHMRELRRGNFYTLREKGRATGSGVLTTCDWEGCREPIVRIAMFHCSAAAGRAGCGGYYCRRHVRMSPATWEVLCLRCAPEPEQNSISRPG